MRYDNYKKLNQVTKKFGLKARLVPLFQDLEPKMPSDFLIKTLHIAYKAPATTEKAKSERLVSPILMEIVQAFEQQVTLFSGEELNVNPNENLSGACDFFFGLYPLSPYLETPIIAIAEAKDEDLEWGIAQCAAQLYAAHLYNQQEGKNIPILYGCTTDGVEWHFIKFEDNVFYIDLKPITDLKEILGAWHQVIRFYL